MLTQQHIQEDLSKAYIQAVAATAGLNLSLGTHSHDYGVDGTFHQVQIVTRTDPAGKLVKRRLNSGFNLEFQCKASIDWLDELDHIVHDLEAKTYNDLVLRTDTTNATPIILILMCLPQNQADWLQLSEHELLLRKCCYWHRLSGEKTVNTSTKRIRIPKAQRLEPAAVSHLLSQVEQGLLK